MAETKRDREIREHLDAIEQKLMETGDLLRILLASRLLRDGHATTWTDAVRLARDLEKVRGLYPEPEDG